MFFLSLIALICFSCEMDEQFSELDVKAQNDLVQGNDTLDEQNNSANFRVGSVIYEETFESSNPLTQYVFRQFPESHSYREANSPVLEGSKSGRFELRKGDAVVTSSGVRAEVLFQRELLDQISNNEAWYSYAVYLPSNGYAKDSDLDVLTQWYDGGSPSLSLRVGHDKFYFRIVKDGITDMIDIGSATKDTWNQFVFHIKHSPNSSGLVEVWRNGEKVVTRSGKNSKIETLPQFKMGIYKSAWASKTTDTNLRILYFDNIKIGNENATLEAMQPTTGSNNIISEESLSPEPSSPAPSSPEVSPSPEFSNTSLVGHWKMDENGGSSLNDYSGNNNHAKIVDNSGVRWVNDGRGGLAINLAQPTGKYYSEVPHNSSLNITEEITISGWIRPHLTANRMILSKTNSNGYELGTSENGKIEFRFNRTSDGSTYRLHSEKNYPTDKTTWMHVAATFNGTKSTIYINGVEDKTATYSKTQIKPNTSQLVIGANGTGYRWEGDLDDIRLYNRALSSGEIAFIAGQ